MLTRKNIVLILLALLMAVSFVFLSGQGGDIESIKSLIENFRIWQSENKFIFAVGFFVVYVIAAAFSLPIAIPMVLAAGAIFGFWQGLLIGSFASSLGALIAFFGARYFMKDSVSARFPKISATINHGVKKDGILYLLSLRLVPLFPFFAINLLMGITSMRAGVYYLTSQLGMLPGTATYVFAGTQLGELRSLGDIVSPGLLIAFALLGIVPWIAKLIMNKIQLRKRYANYTKPKSFDRNLIVIGAGAAGLVSSYIGATLKAKVTLIEAGDMGGDCLNTGCVPSKSLIASGALVKKITQSEEYGVQSHVSSVDFSKVIRRVRNVIEEIAPHDSVERYTGLGVEVVKGYATLTSPWGVDIRLNDGGQQSLTARNIILATGAEPFVPSIEGVESVDYLTSETIWNRLSELDAPPKKFVVIGGGVIGCELGQALARLGSKVTIVEANERILPREDREISDAVLASLVADGVEVCAGHSAVKFTPNRLFIQKGEDVSEIEFDEVLIAIGRRPRLKGFGLEELGIDTDQKLERSPYLETQFPNIFAAGDLAGPYQLTHAAAHEAWFASVNALFGRFKKFRIHYKTMPSAIFTSPETARVGINEQEAREQAIKVDVVKFELKELDRAIIEGKKEGFIKVLTRSGSDKILGVTILGENASAFLPEFTLAMQNNIGLNKLLRNTHAYPSWGEANKYVAGEWKRKHTKAFIFKWLEKYQTWMRG